MQKHLRLSSLIHVFFLFGCSLIQLARTDSTAAWYHQQLRDTVVPHYRSAYTTLNDGIVQKLLTVNLDIDDTEMESLNKALICTSRTVLRHSSAAARASEQMRQSLESQTSQVVLDISNQQNQVRDSEHAVSQGNLDVQSAEQQVAFGETAVRDKQHELNVAIHGANEAQRAVDKARLCGLGRRRKRGFGRWWRKHVEKPFVNVVRHVAIRPVCSVVNSGGIDNAKERRGLAEQSLHAAQQRLSQHQQNLAQRQAQRGSAQVQLQQAVAQLNQLNSQLSDQQAKHRVIVSLVEQFMRVEVHLKNVLDSSVVLDEAIRQLINFELVITPLNAICQEMINNQVMSAFGFEISAAVIANVNTNLSALGEKMSSMLMNTNPVDSASTACA